MTSDLISYRTLVEALDAAPADSVFVAEWHDDDDRENITFGEFRRRARMQAAFLQQHGARSGDRVVLILPQGIPLMTAFAGAMMLGVVPAILAYPNSKVEPAKYRSGLAGLTANLQAHLIVIDENFPHELLEHIAADQDTKLVKSPRLNEKGRQFVADNSSILPDQLAFIQHSGGTTGLQKGVALSHRAILSQIRNLATVLDIRATEDRLYSWLPLYHDMGLIACFMLPMVCHLPVVMQSPSEWVMRPSTMLQLCSEYRCTLAWLPNFTFQFVARRTPQNISTRYDLSSLRALINCSEPVSVKSMNEFYETFSSHGLKKSALHTSYAMAENVFAVTQSGPKGPAQIFADGLRFRSEKIIEQASPTQAGAIALTSSGRLLPNNRARIVSETGDTLPDGSVGEIVIQSDSLFNGYFHRPDLTSIALLHGWYHTGDLGFFLDGELFVVGRKKDLLIVGGENIYPQDLEEIVSTHSAIHDGRVVALGIFNRDLGTEDIAIVAEVENEKFLSENNRIEREIRASVFSILGVAVRFLFLKPPKWIVKSTAGKPARSATREKLLREHPELLTRDF
jgi:acyl-CoA synthetase (AMP-forming)/AMP-acid ligase II